MIDLLYLAHNRLEFTKVSLAALIANTNWEQVERLFIYDDASEDGTRQYITLIGRCYPVAPKMRFGSYGSPVAVMNDYLSVQSPHDDRIFAKVDSDTMVPPHWLDECLKVMDKHPSLDLLGIEAFNPVVADSVERSFSEARFIGGIGLMRTSAFVTLPRPNGRFGFTAWQDQTKKVKADVLVDIEKGWIDPSLPVFLLDRLPFEPWTSLSAEYVAKGWQRPWAQYGEKDKALWSWWTA